MTDATRIAEEVLASIDSGILKKDYNIAILAVAIRDLTSALEKAEREKAKMAKALKPFACAADKYMADHWPLASSIDEIEWILTSDLCAAKAALSEGVG